MREVNGIIKKIAPLLALSIIVFVFLGSGCDVSKLPSLLSPITVVPDLKGLDITAAEKKLDEARLNVRKKVTDFSDEIKPDSIIWTDPQAGTKVKKGTAVTLVLSIGPKPVPIPSVAGASEAQASQVIAGAGFTVTVSRTYSDSAPEGVVIGTNPPAGTQCPPKSTVCIVVSQGPEYVTCSQCGGRGKTVIAVTCPECEGTGLCYG